MLPVLPPPLPPLFHCYQFQYTPITNPLSLLPRSVNGNVHGVVIHKAFYQPSSHSVVSESDVCSALPPSSAPAVRPRHSPAPKAPSLLLAQTPLPPALLLSLPRSGCNFAALSPTSPTSGKISLLLRWRPAAGWILPMSWCGPFRYDYAFP